MLNVDIWLIKHLIASYKNEKRRGIDNRPPWFLKPLWDIVMDYVYSSHLVLKSILKYPDFVVRFDGFLFSASHCARNAGDACETCNSHLFGARDGYNGYGHRAVSELLWDPKINPDGKYAREARRILLDKLAAGESQHTARLDQKSAL